jgi:hypothetical protein
MGVQTQADAIRVPSQDPNGRELWLWATPFKAEAIRPLVLAMPLVDDPVISGGTPIPSLDDFENDGDEDQEQPDNDLSVVKSEQEIE